MSLFLTVFRLRQISSGTIIPTSPIILWVDLTTWRDFRSRPGALSTSRLGSRIALSLGPGLPDRGFDVNELLAGDPSGQFVAATGLGERKLGHGWSLCSVVVVRE
jgi:hypothetical protein